MAERKAIRSIPLSTPIHEGDRTIDELEFLEPGSTLFDELERAQEWNAHVKKRKNIVATGLVLLEHLTGLHESTLATMSFKDRKAANEVAAELMGAELDEGEI